MWLQWCVASHDVHSEEVQDRYDEDDIGSEVIHDGVTEDGVKIDIISGLRENTEKACERSEFPVLVSVTPPVGEKRAPVQICCVVDISWSMTMEAIVHTSTGVAESNGLSLLDIAKHALRTVVCVLNDQDSFSLVTFCSTAEVVLPLTRMDAEGRALAEEKIDEIGFGNGTELWRGIQKGLDVLVPTQDGKSGGQNHFAHLMVLTDGETTDREVVLPNLRAVKEQHGRLPCTISAFGFGYEIDSALLTAIADFASGTFAFIPDASFVGTVFVNCISNLLVTMADCVSLVVHSSKHAIIKDIKGGISASNRSDGSICFDIGNLQYGQSKDLLFGVSVSSASGAEAELCVSLKYTPCEGLSRHVKTRMQGLRADPAHAHLIEKHQCRCVVIDSLKRAWQGLSDKTEDNLKLGAEYIDRAKQFVEMSSVIHDDYVQALLTDLNDQISAAFSRLDWYTKWGQHYIPSVAFAHKLQQCNNFKDAGVQFYGGDMFHSLQEIADDIFCELRMSKITPAKYRYLGGGPANVIKNPAYMRHREGLPSPQAIDMAQYNNAANACIDGQSTAQLISGKAVQVCELVRGDIVASSDGNSAEVVYVVRTGCLEGMAPLVELPGGARVTPHHPVKLDGCWCFPADVGAIEYMSCQAVYSLVLRGAPDFLVDGVPCAALGHGLSEGAAKHPYLGSQTVVDDLARLPGAARGFIDLLPAYIHRDPHTGLICALAMPDDAQDVSCAA